MIGGLLLFFRSTKIVRGQWCPLAWHFYRAIAMELPPAVMEADCDEILAASSSIELPPSISEEHQDAGPTKKKAKSVRTGKTNRTQPLQPFPVPSLCLPDPVESDTLLTYWSSLGVELPEAVDLGDDSDDHDDFFVLETIVEDKAKEPLKVPTPPELAAMKNPLKQLAVGYYSPPRVLPHIGSCKCFLSLDLLTGWDFTDAKNPRLSMEALQKYDVDMCILSPPCTMFSALQILFSNFEKWTPQSSKRGGEKPSNLLRTQWKLQSTRFIAKSISLLNTPGPPAAGNLKLWRKSAVTVKLAKFISTNACWGWQAPAANFSKKEQL